MVSGNLIKIGLAGRTNSGKTTTIRTLMRRAVGVVGDQPNVTREVEAIRSEQNDPKTNLHIGIQAIFYDCPGFQMASLSRHFIDDLAKLLNMDEKAKYDARAIEALREVDVVIYVANLEDVPNDSYVNEIELIKAIEKPCVILLNKFRHRAEQGSESGVRERAIQWRQKMSEVSNFPILPFDAHWKNPSSTKELYTIVKELLPADRVILFEEGLKNFYDNQDVLRKRVTSALVKLMCSSRKRVSVDEGKDGVKWGEGAESLKAKIEEVIKEAVEDYFLEISEIYRLSATQSVDDDIAYGQSTETRFWKVVTTGTTVAGICTAVGTTTGAAIGAVLGFFGLAGVGAAPMAAAGAQVGATIAGTLGFGLGAIGGTGSHYEGQVSEEFLQLIFDRGIGLAYTMACHGFGLGTALRDEDVSAMLMKAHTLRKKKYDDIVFSTASEREIDFLAQAILREMEDE